MQEKIKVSDHKFDAGCPRSCSENHSEFMCIFHTWDGGTIEDGQMIQCDKSESEHEETIYKTSIQEPCKEKK